jgi:hypothetical protein
MPEVLHPSWDLISRYRQAIGLDRGKDSLADLHFKCIHAWEPRLPPPTPAFRCAPLGSERRLTMLHCGFFMDAISNFGSGSLVENASLTRTAPKSMTASIGLSMSCSGGTAPAISKMESRQRLPPWRKLRGDDFGSVCSVIPKRISVQKLVDKIIFYQPGVRSRQRILCPLWPDGSAGFECVMIRSTTDSSASAAPHTTEISYSRSYASREYRLHFAPRPLFLSLMIFSSSAGSSTLTCGIVGGVFVFSHSSRPGHHTGAASAVVGAFAGC